MQRKVKCLRLLSVSNMSDEKDQEQDESRSRPYRYHKDVCVVENGRSTWAQLGDNNLMEVPALPTNLDSPRTDDKNRNETQRKQHIKPGVNFLLENEGIALKVQLGDHNIMKPSKLQNASQELSTNCLVADRVPTARNKEVVNSDMEYHRQKRNQPSESHAKPFVFLNTGTGTRLQRGSFNQMQIPHSHSTQATVFETEVIEAPGYDDPDIVCSGFESSYQIGNHNTMSPFPCADGDSEFTSQHRGLISTKEKSELSHPAFCEFVDEKIKNYHTNKDLNELVNSNNVNALENDNDKTYSSIDPKQDHGSLQTDSKEYVHEEDFEPTLQDERSDIAENTGIKYTDSQLEPTAWNDSEQHHEGSDGQPRRQPNDRNSDLFERSDTYAGIQDDANEQSFQNQDRGTSSDRTSYLNNDLSMDGCLSQIKKDIIWEYENPRGFWQRYDEKQNEKLNRNFDSRPEGTCLIQKNGKSYRIIFRDLLERCVNDPGMPTCRVRRNDAGDTEENSLFRH